VAHQPAPAPPGFRFDEVSVVVDGTVVLDRLSAELPCDGVTVVVGPSGAGKTTLLRLCNRLDVPTAGTVWFAGSDVAAVDPIRLRRRVGMVFQRPVLFAGTVADNLRVADPRANGTRLAGVMARVGLDPALAERAADDLSGGEAQRLCIARALLTEPEVLLMDEPTSALDPGHRGIVERLARHLAGTGTPVVWVTHDLAQAERLADRTLVLVDGRVADRGEAEAFLRGPAGGGEGLGRA
jgi:putative ABC transport system ATP-binding protein